MTILDQVLRDPLRSAFLEFRPTTLAQIIRSMFMNNEEGWWYDFDVAHGWRYNLLTWTEDFSNAAWGKNEVTVNANTTIAPNGTLTASKLIESAALGTHQLVYSLAMQSEQIKLSFFAKAAERSKVVIFGNWNLTCVFDLTTGTASGGGSTATPSITHVGNGWYLCNFESTVFDTSLRSYGIRILNSAGEFSYTGDGVSGVYIWGASLTTAANADKPYQAITDGIQDYYTYANPLPVLYQDAVGTQPVTQMEQFVGLILDKSKGLVLGPELVTNGDFSQGVTAWGLGTGWSVTDGKASIDGSNAASSLLSQAMPSPLSVGRAYLMEYTATVIAGRIRINSSAGLTTQITAGKSGVFKEIVFAASSNTAFALQAIDAGTIATIDNISVRELPGNHAYQPTLTKRMKVSRRVNLLAKTEDFADAVWSANIGVNVTKNAISAPNGTLTGNLVTTTGATFHAVAYPGITWTGGLRRSVYLKKDNWRYVGISDRRNDGGGLVLDFDTGTVLGHARFSNPEVIPLVDGWFRISYSVDEFISTFQNGVVVQFFNNQSTNPTTSVGLVDARVYVWGASATIDIESHLPYQRVNTDTDYDDDPAKFPTYLKPDVIDDCYITNEIDLTGTDKINVWAGITKLSDAAGAIAFEFGSNTNVSNGAFALYAPGNFGTNRMDFSSRGTLTVTAIKSDLGTPISTVAAGIGDIGGRTAKLLINNLEVALATADQGTGNYGKYPLNIGARDQTSAFFNGKIYPMLGRGALSNASQHATVNSYIKQKMMLP